MKPKNRNQEKQIPTQSIQTIHLEQLLHTENNYQELKVLLKPFN
jgi:hypothetical protein